MQQVSIIQKVSCKENNHAVPFVLEGLVAAARTAMRTEDRQSNS